MHGVLAGLGVTMLAALTGMHYGMFVAHDASILWLFVAISMIAGCFAYYLVNRVKLDIKTLLTEKVCHFFGLRYSELAPDFRVKRFRGLGLVPGHGRSSVESLIAGRHGSVDVEIAEVELQARRTRRRGKRGSETAYETVFHGLLCRLTFPAPFEGRTVVSTDPRLVETWLAEGGPEGMRIGIENTRHEDIVDAYGTEETEARRLLTHPLLEALIALGERVGKGSMSLVSDGDHLLLAISTEGDRFRDRLVLPEADDQGRVAVLLAEISILFDLIDAVGAAPSPGRPESVEPSSRPRRAWPG